MILLLLITFSLGAIFGIVMGELSDRFDKKHKRGEYWEGK